MELLKLQQVKGHVDMLFHQLQWLQCNNSYFAYGYGAVDETGIHLNPHLNSSKATPERMFSFHYFKGVFGMEVKIEVKVS